MNRMTIGIGSGVLILLIALFFSGLFIGDFVIGVVVSVITTAIIYFKLVFPYCTFDVPPDKGWLLANSLKNEDATKRSTFSGYRQIRAQKEFQAGFHWKYFWEKPHKEVDMIRQFPIESAVDQGYTMSTGKTVEIRWRVFVTPLPGSLINFERTRPDDIEKRVRDRVESFLQGYIGGLNIVKFDQIQIDTIKKKFEEIFGGPNTIDPEEEQLGIWTGTPEILHIGQPKAVEEAKNFEAAMGASIRVAQAMVTTSGGELPFEKAMKLTLVGSGNAKVDYVELAGVFDQSGNRRKSKRNQAQQEEE